jgi:hypothetical protein
MTRRCHPLSLDVVSFRTSLAERCTAPDARR